MNLFPTIILVYFYTLFSNNIYNLFINFIYNQFKWTKEETSRSQVSQMILWTISNLYYKLKILISHLLSQIQMITCMRIKKTCIKIIELLTCLIMILWIRYLNLFRRTWIKPIRELTELSRKETYNTKIWPLNSSDLINSKRSSKNIYNKLKIVLDKGWAAWPFYITRS